LDAGDCGFLQIEAVSRRRRSAQNHSRNCGCKGYGRNLLMEWTQHGGSESLTASTLPMQKWQKVLFWTEILPESTNQHLMAALCRDSH
jgi:hypothetical protein